MQRHLHYMRNVRPFDAVVGASGAQIVEKVVSSIIGAMRRSTATLSVLFAIAAFLLSAACGGDDGMHRYLETADAAFEEVRLSQVKVQGAFGALPRITDPQFFTALATASEDGAGVADDALTDWRKIKPADDSKAFHKRVEDDLDRVKSLYKAISESPHRRAMRRSLAPTPTCLRCWRS